MKSLVLSLSVIFSSVLALANVSAKAVTTHKYFNISTDAGFNGKVYYNCDTVEDSAMALLQKWEQDIRVHCSGGIDNSSPEMAWPATVDMSYQSLKMADANTVDTVSAQFVPVEVRTSGNCFLMSQLFAEVKSSFEIQNLTGTSRCSNVDSKFALKFLSLQ